MKQLTVVNHTSEILTLENGPEGQRDLRVLLPSLSSTARLSRSTRDIKLSSAHRRDGAEKEWTVTAHNITIRLPVTMEASWKMVSVPDGCPWRIYRSRLSKKHDMLLILPHRDLSSFLSEMPDSLPLSSLMLPGTHDTMAFYGWPISQCQSLATPLANQFHSGIRVVDIRLAIVDNRLIAYHGLYPQHAPFQEVLSAIHGFLTAQATCRETIIMSIKQEDFMTSPQVLFSKLVHDEIMNGPGGRSMWFLENRIPTLGEVRGKVIMFSRFGGDGVGWERGLEGIGIHPSTWPDSAKAGFTWQCKDTLVRTHDWYNIPSFLSIPEKTELATQILLPRDHSAFSTLAISYFSASSFPLAFPPTVARGFGWPKWGLGVEGVNGRVGKWLLDMLTGQASGGHASDGEKRISVRERGTSVRIRGWALLDFYRDPEDNGVVPLLVECNYRGRKAGEEGW